MTNFKLDDHVLVDLGIPVPGIISYVSVYDNVTDVYVTIPHLGETVFDSEHVTLDPSKRTWVAGDIVSNASEVTTLPYNTVLIDADNSTFEWDTDEIWMFGSNSSFSTDYVEYPATIIYVPKEHSDE